MWVARVISRPLRTALDVAQQVAKGDLTSSIEVESADETGQLMLALRNMNDNLLKIVGRVRHSTDEIATACGEIATGNLDLSARTEEQASSLEETASSMEELTSTVKHNADNARQANQLAATATSVAAKGGDVVSQVVETMNSIHDSSRKIVDIIAVIDGIAFQTNILALNAAVNQAVSQMDAVTQQNAAPAASRRCCKGQPSTSRTSSCGPCPRRSTRRPARAGACGWPRSWPRRSTPRSRASCLD